jgi:hypothetical protein
MIRKAVSIQSGGRLSWASWLSSGNNLALKYLYLHADQSPNRSAQDHTLIDRN